MAQWYFQNNPENVVSGCSGWDCTLQCSGGPWMPTNTPCASTTNVCANTYMYTTPPAPSGGATQSDQAQPDQAQAQAQAPQAAPPMGAVSLAPALPPGQLLTLTLAPEGAPSPTRLAGRTRHSLVLASLLVSSLAFAAFCQHYCTRAQNRLLDDARRTHAKKGASEATALL